MVDSTDKMQHFSSNNVETPSDEEAAPSIQRREQQLSIRTSKNHGGMNESISMEGHTIARPAATEDENNYAAIHEDRRVGAFAIAGPDFNPNEQSDDDYDEEEPSRATSLVLDSPLNNENMPISAERVDREQEAERIRQLVQQTLEREREHAQRDSVLAVAQVLTNEEEQPTESSDRENVRRIAAVTVLAMVSIVAVVLALVFRPRHTTDEDINAPTPVPSLSPTIVNSLEPSLSPTIAPTEGGFPSSPSNAAATPSAPDALLELTELLTFVSFDNGTALTTEGSPQNKAFHWLLNNTNLDSYSNERKIQRYALATLYYSTNGDFWNHDDNWLTNGYECDWHSGATGSKCSSDHVMLTLHLGRNNLVGSIPDELILLTSLGTC